MTPRAARGPGADVHPADAEGTKAPPGHPVAPGPGLGLGRGEWPGAEPWPDPYRWGPDGYAPRPGEVIDTRRDPAGRADGPWTRHRARPAAPAGSDTLAGRRFVRGVHAVAGAVAVLAVGWTAWHGVAQPQVALTWGALIALGEATWRPHPGGRDGRTPRPPAPVGAAGALAYALLGQIGGREAVHGVPQVVAVVFAATLAGAIGRPPALDELARRVLTTAFVAGCFQPPHHTGVLDRWPGHGPYYVIYLLSLLVLSTLGDALLAAALTRARTGGRYGRALRTELRAVEGPGTAIHATGVVMAPAVGAAGLWALPALGLPLLFVQLGARRPEAARVVRHQTVAALARATEIAGHVPAGRSHRVAALGRAVGRELGLSAAELDAVEHAALLRDVGRLALPDPAPPAERRRAALLAGAVARRAGVPAAVAVAVERQGEPYRAQPLAARIVATVRAYDDFATPADYDDPTGAEARGPLRALERLRLATAYDHEPRVVEALARVLSRCAPAPADLR
ncbi:HD-GYP domain-containing protein [Streptomyces netropsis]